MTERGTRTPGRLLGSPSRGEVGGTGNPPEQIIFHREEKLLRKEGKPFTPRPAAHDYDFAYPSPVPIPIDTPQLSQTLDDVCAINIDDLEEGEGVDSTPRHRDAPRISNEPIFK